MRTEYRVVAGGLRGKVTVTRNAGEAVRLLRFEFGTLYVMRGSRQSYPIRYDSQLTNAQQMERLRQAREYLERLEARADMEDA